MIKEVQINFSRVVVDKVIPDQTLGINNRRRDGVVIKIIAFKATANLTVLTAVRTLYML